MASVNKIEPRSTAAGGGSVGQALVAALALAATLIVIWGGFVFLRDSQATIPKWLTTIIAIIWGVGGVAALFFSANMLIEQFGDRAKSYLRPFVFVGPAVFMLGWFLFLPTLRTLYLSFFNNDSTRFIGLDNYAF
nr:hypothetical protein [Chloroflexaceae bacterium]